MTSGLNRRNVLGGATAAAIGVPVLAACGSDPADSATDPATSPSSSSTDAGSEAPGGAGAGASLAATGDIPVGGCAVFSEQKCVVTQPSKGDFKAFTSVCTHQGCTVSAATDGVIPCSCHGSEFSIEDGSVLQGPATEPLAAVAITVEGDSIILA
jgi:Rieske Fe-S protein